MVLYADDMLLFRPVCTAADYVDFQNDIDLVSQWVKNHHLTFNVGKSISMLITRHRNHLPPHALCVADNHWNKSTHFNI